MKKKSYITPDQRNDLKSRIEKFGRREFCDRYGYSYGVLTNKLNGFARISETEAETIEKQLEGA